MAHSCDQPSGISQIHSAGPEPRRKHCCDQPSGISQIHFGSVPSRVDLVVISPQVSVRYTLVLSRHVSI